MRIVCIFLALSFFGQELFGQISRPTKSQLLNIFKSSIGEENRNKRAITTTGSVSWLICNKDSSFYKSDTLYLYGDNYGDASNYYIQIKDCCNVIGLVFYRKAAFAQVEQELCRSRSKVVTNKDFYTVAISDENNQTIMKVLRNKQLIDTFNVIAFEEISLLKEERSNKRLTLVRQKI
ncbi:hypothetical protein [Emticicia sp. C21]|uniref:hypothetical protein n=1 Tax=Emticicia sp. C21 TaxID=2302915 RepID=UPI000E345974|nr:hypothetical protein [Emticicia sp. C21]RFS17303.1 hypothetical protein D0T08_05845 [Emticicia sp. C21]